MLRTVLLLTILLGLLPLAITHAVVSWALSAGANTWPDWLFATIFTVFHLALIGLGAWVYSYLAHRF
jgi:hypothetical protein